MSEPNKLNEAGPSQKADEPEPVDTGTSPTKPIRILRSMTDKYEVIKEIGKGTFGLVYKCSALRAGETVAVKILNIRRSRCYPDSGFKKKSWFKAEKEYEICHLFKGAQNIVQAFDIFLHFNLPCLVFECLDENLLQIIHREGPMPVKKARHLMEQLFSALGALKDKDLIHGDLKPENLMLKYLTNSRPLLKIIDFGGAMYLSDCSEITVFQTLHFRAPEVIICAPRSVKVDMWSAGCIFAEMLSARRLYPGNTPDEQMFMIDKCQGPLPDHVLAKGYNTSRYFRRTSDEYQMIGDEFLKAMKVDELDPYYTFQTDTLFEITGFDESCSPEERLHVLSLLELMLHLDEGWRCSPEEGLCHQFFDIDENME